MLLLSAQVRQSLTVPPSMSSLSDSSNRSTEDVEVAPVITKKKHPVSKRELRQIILIMSSEKVFSAFSLMEFFKCFVFLTNVFLTHVSNSSAQQFYHSLIVVINFTKLGVSF